MSHRPSARSSPSRLTPLSRPKQRSPAGVMTLRPCGPCSNTAAASGLRRRTRPGPIPRPDLIGDHARWLLVLDLAYHRDAADPEGVFGALFGARCCGARIEHMDDDWTLKPEGPPPRWRLARGEIPADEWAAIRARWLLPHRAALVEILLGRKA